MAPYAREYSRKKILEKGMSFTGGWMDLIYTRHAMERLKQRLRGNLMIYPKQINISTLNIYKGYSYNDKKLHKVIIRLEYNKYEWIFLVILPDKRVVKSLWFQNKNERKNYRAVQAIPGDMEESGREDMPVVRPEDIWPMQTPILGPPSGKE